MGLDGLRMDKGEGNMANFIHSTCRGLSGCARDLHDRGVR